MARWQSEYQPGDRVEAFLPTLREWRSGVVLNARHEIRVKMDDGRKYDWVVTRKGEIRKVAVQ